MLVKITNILREIAADESAVGFRDRIIFKTYNPKKQTKRGLLVSVLGDSETGYISSIVVYFGSTTTERLPYTSRIVLHLCDHLSQFVGEVYKYCFYTSCGLAVELFRKGFHLAGIAKKSRKSLATQSKKLKMKNGEVHSFHQNDSMVTLMWEDKGVLLMFSTYHSVRMQREERVVGRGVRIVYD
jgi:hypothetical protein